MTTKHKAQNRYWGDREIPKTKREFFDAVVAPPPSGETPSVATIRMYGPIDSWGGYWGISAKDVGGVLDALPDSVSQIVLHINSPGGLVFEGMAILNMLRAHRATVTAVVDGIAASAASVIAAGCDETVMSPGTQMMIHSPSSIVWGNAVEMRKEADVLDSIERSLIEIYVGKAGEKDWAALLKEETWLTATDAVGEGLADRVAVIPDAGEAATVGDEDDDLLLVPDEDEPEDMARARVIRIAAHGRKDLAAFSAAHRPPSSSEPGEPNQKEVAVGDSLKAGLRQRLGVVDAAASDETLLEALDEALAEQADTPTIPENTTLIDKEALAALQSDAAAGREAREEQVRVRREAIVDAAQQDGRISPSSRDSWLGMLAKDESGAAAILGNLPKNLAVNTVERGGADELNSADDALYGSIYGKKEN